MSIDKSDLPHCYGAAATDLEKGHDVVELLVVAARPLTMSKICQQLCRSMFRMALVLQSPGFLDQDDAVPWSNNCPLNEWRALGRALAVGNG